MKGKAKWLAIPLALSMLAGFCGCSSGEGATGTVPMAETNPEFFQYEIISETASIRITDYNGTDSVVVIPAEFEERKVTAIGEGTFEGNQVITEVVIPDTVTEIEDQAFTDSTLEKVTLPGELKVIGDSAFYGTKLTEIALPDGLEDIGSKAFSELPLETVDLPEGLVTIGYQAFYRTNITEVTIPEGVITIDGEAFSKTPLSSVTFPSTLETIGGSCFIDTNLEEVSIPESVTRMGNLGSFDTQAAMNGILSNVRQLDHPPFDDGITVYGKSGSFAELYCEYQRYHFVAE